MPRDNNSKPRYKSDAFKAIHNSAGAMYKAGTIDKTTMRRFDAFCLAVPTEIAPADIERLRESHQVSEAQRVTRCSCAARKPATEGAFRGRRKPFAS